MPVSISSKITVEILSKWAKTVFRASIILEISPPEATFINGAKLFALFVVIKNSTLFLPFEFKLVSSTLISKFAASSSSFLSSLVIRLDNSIA